MRRAVQNIQVFSVSARPLFIFRFPGMSIFTLALTSIILIGNGSAHAVKVPGLVFLSGQVPVDKSGKIVSGGIREHTVRLTDAEVYGLMWA